MGNIKEIAGFGLSEDNNIFSRGLSENVTVGINQNGKWYSTGAFSGSFDDCFDSNPHETMVLANLDKAIIKQVYSLFAGEVTTVKSIAKLIESKSFLDVSTKGGVSKVGEVLIAIIDPAIANYYVKNHGKMEGIKNTFDQLEKLFIEYSKYEEFLIGLLNSLRTASQELDSKKSSTKKIIEALVCLTSNSQVKHLRSAIETSSASVDDRPNISVYKLEELGLNEGILNSPESMLSFLLN